MPSSYKELDEFAPYDYYIHAAYAELVEAFGARVVPIQCDESDDVTLEKMKSLNGILFPGGAPLSCYAAKGQYVFEQAVKMNDEGTRFPLYGICMGFELFAVYSSSKNWDVLSDKYSKNVMLPLDFLVDNAATDTQMFEDAGDMIDLYASHPFAFQSHGKGLDLSEFDDLMLSDMFEATSTSTDPSTGATFVSTMESHDYPFYGVQFHPEKVVHVYYEHKGLTHTWTDIKLNQYFGEFFVKQSRMTSVDPGTNDEVQDKIIQNVTELISTRAYGDMYAFKAITPADEPSDV